MSTMGSFVSRESSPAAEPSPATTSTPVAAAAHPTNDLSGRTTAVPSQDKKRKADDVSAEEDALPSASASSSSRAAKRARVQEEHSGGVTTPASVQVRESIFGGPVGPPRLGAINTTTSSSPSNSSDASVLSRLKRARVDDPSSDEEVVFVRAQLAEARVTSSSPPAAAAATIIDDSSRGKKRAADDDDGDLEVVEAYPIKRLRAHDTTYFVEDEAADVEEMVPGADLTSSAADIVRAAAAADANSSDDLALVVATAERRAAHKTGFFDLPLEIREMIYHQVLIARKTVMPRVPQRNQAYRIGFPIGKLSSLLLAVAPVDRHTNVIKNEIMPFLFKHNEFKLTLKHHKAWLNTIPRKHAASIRKVVVECDGKNKHAVQNLVAFQNTMRKRLGGDALRELTYQFLWSMNPQTAVRYMDAKEFRLCWSKFKRLEKITIDTSNRRNGIPYVERLIVEEHERVLSRLALDTGVKIHARALRPWRRDKASLAWGIVELKEGWEEHVEKNKKEGKMVPKLKMRDSWGDIVNIRVKPTATAKMGDEDDE